jgi:hypothetical protein
MIDDRSIAELQRLQGEILEAVARGESLARVADHLCRRVEALAPDALCSILTVDAQGRLHTLAAPSLPEAYSRSLDGMPSGPAAGSCGTAAWRGAAVEVSAFGEYGGWGVRFGRSGNWGVITRAGSAIEVQRRSGANFVVTVDDAATGAGLPTSLASRG